VTIAMDVSRAAGERPAGETRLFHSLAGEWRLSRSIPGSGSVTGVARFHPLAPDVLRYEEEGVLRLDSGAALAVRREYRYVLEPGGIRVMFAAPGASGDTLHVLRLAGGSDRSWPAVATAVHLCGADTYAGEYRFESASRITIAMLVRGPAKRYRIETVLERSGPGS
jgi:hypothetical protein